MPSWTDDLVVGEIQILNPQAQAFHQAQPAAIEHARDELWIPDIKSNTWRTSWRVNTVGRR
jgi:hypothetical protein